MLRQTPICALLLSALIGGVPAWAQAEEAPQTQVPPDPAVVDELTDLVVQAMPLDEIIPKALIDAPQLTPEQKQCLRDDQTARQSYREAKRQDVIDFMAHYPDEVEESVRVLKDGTAEALSVLVRVVFLGKPGGEGTQWAQWTDAQLKAMQSKVGALENNPKYQHLRDMLGSSNDGLMNAVNQQRARVMITCKIGLDSPRR
ncbi:MAG: hypothetical protein LBG66_02165 [Gallionellaceae bacterium]|nr:hypothetical protein [Gallionellaceae bacterium]